MKVVILYVVAITCLLYMAFITNLPGWCASGLTSNQIIKPLCKG